MNRTWWLKAAILWAYSNHIPKLPVLLSPISMMAGAAPKTRKDWEIGGQMGVANSADQMTAGGRLYIGLAARHVQHLNAAGPMKLRGPRNGNLNGHLSYLSDAGRNESGAQPSGRVAGAVAIWPK